MRLLMDAGPLENTHRWRGIGGLTRQLLPALCRLDRPGVELAWLSRREPDPATGHDQWVRRSFAAEIGGAHPAVPEPLAERWKSVDAAVFLPREVDRSGADVFLATDPRGVALGKGFRTVPILYDLVPLIFRDRYLPRQAVLKGRRYRADLRRTQRAHRWVAISEASRHDAIRLLDLDPGAVRVVYPGIDQDEFFPASPDPARERIADWWGVRSPYFLYTGGFDFRKNLEGLVRAFAPLADTGATLVITGPMKGPGDRLRERIARTPLRDAVRFLGYVPTGRLRDLYAGAVALVFPSLYEGFGFPVAEAMACGTPVITSPVSSMPEVAGEAALYADPADSAALSAAMGRLLQEPGLRQELIGRGIERAKRFTWTEAAAAILETCREAAP